MKVFFRAFISYIFSCYAVLNAFAFEADTARTNSYDSLARNIYQQFKSDELSFEAFRSAYYGYGQVLQQNLIEKKDLLTIIDFSRSSKEERFFIIDLSKQDIIHESLVAHGKNSGWDTPASFSNLINSNKSSLGFYVTGETYFGKHGLSLKLDGLEEGINDNARKRYIVIHAADYVNDEIIGKLGRLGRSFGCPSLPKTNYNKIIDLLKDKSLIFIYSNQQDYFNKSDYL